MKKEFCAVVLAVSLGGCSTIQGWLGQSPSDAFVNDAVAALKGYKAYEIGLAAWGSTPVCGTQPCHDKALYLTLYNADLAVKACIPLAQAALKEQTPDLSIVNPCMLKISNIQVTMDTAGIKPLKVTP